MLILWENTERGDIRHCYADVSKIRERLNFEPKVEFDDGILDLIRWVRNQRAPDKFEKCREELEKRRLTRQTFTQ